MALHADEIRGLPLPATGSGDDHDGRAEGKPFAELLHDLSTQITAVVHDEFELARAEMADKGQHAATGIGAGAAAAVLALLASGALTAAAVIGLSQVLASWLAAIVVAVAYLAVAGALALSGRRALSRAAPPLPTEAVEHAKEDVKWVRAHSKHAKR